MRPDYCPVGGQPCQRMCVTPCKAPSTLEPNNPGECSECHAPVGSVCSDADCPGKAAPLITKPTDFVSLLREADEIVRAKPTWRRFIDGTPLSNDIAVWMVAFAQDVARRNAAAALEQQAEPVQEPVAYIHRQGNHWEVSERHLTDDEKARGWTEKPLYTAPPQRKPLTDEEIEKLFGGAVADVPRAHWLRQAAIEVVRKTERAHGIGEEE